MPRIFSRLAVCLCAAVVCFSGVSARAEFSPRYAALAGNGGVEAGLCASFETLAPLSEESLAVVNDWLSRIRLTLRMEEDGTRTLSQAEAALDGQTAFSVSTLAQSDYTLTAFSPSGGAYLTAPGAPDALALLAGDSCALPALPALAKLYDAWAPALYPLLAEFVQPKASKTTTSIKNAAASAAYENYPLTAEQMNEAWPRILETLLPPLKTALKDQPRYYEQAEALLRTLTFSGECRFKRFLDQDGGDMGLQFTGRAARDGDVRKVTLFGGYTPGRGGYVSLSLPAVSGKNNFKATFTGRLSEKKSQRTLTLEGTYTRTLNGETQSAALNVSLKNALKDDREEWSGKATLGSRSRGVKSSWTLTPVLSFTDEGLQGQVSIRRKQDGDQTLKAVVSLFLRATDSLPRPEAAAAKDLRGMDEAQARAVAAAELAPLTRSFTTLLAALPEETRSVLTHEMRTDEWMTAPAVDVQAAPESPETEESPWIVEEEEEP